MATEKINLGNLRLKSSTDLHRAIQKTANWVKDGLIDPKQANALCYLFNTMISLMKYEDNKPVELEVNDTMKNSRQYNIQYLVRMAEITEDEAKRKYYLDEAEKLIFQGISQTDKQKVLRVIEEG